MVVRLPCPMHLASSRKFRVLTVVRNFSRDVWRWSRTTRFRVFAYRGNWIVPSRCGARHAWWSATTAPSSPHAPSGLAGRKGRGMALHRARQADPERLHRELQWPAARRVPQRAPLRQLAGGQKDHRRIGGPTTTHRTARTRASTELILTKFAARPTEGHNQNELSP